MSKQAALIVNGKSRRGREAFRDVEAALKSAGFELVLSEMAMSGSKLDKLTERAVKLKTPIICVGAGDGGLSLVSKHFIGSESTLGVIPLGTGNALARDLNIPSDVNQAVQIIAEGEPRSIDIGTVHGQTFVNVATVGLTTRIAESLTDDAKKRFGRAVYLFAIFKAVAKARPFEANLTVDGETHSFRSIQIVVANGRYHAGPFPVTPDADIQSGMLAGYAVTCAKRSTLFKYAINLWLRRQTQMPEVFPFSAHEVHLGTSPAKRITIDGEIKFKTPARFEVLSNALRVMTPRS